mmetsp:Transcript_31002/g.83225  ORF Transcript_31002/g.83225 Transcript_31002/m.83225 type:complete len:233 (-) Transcript_31002:507-1205(-)
MQILPGTEFPSITNMSPYSRSMLSGLVDIGDLLYSVEDKSRRETVVRGLDIASVVQLILGTPNSWVKLGILRENSGVDVPPAPVMVEPYSRLEAIVRRDLSTSKPEAGLGVLFYKAKYEHLGVEQADGSVHFPIIVQALTGDGSACQSGSVLPGDIVNEINGEDIRAQEITSITEKLRGTPGASVRLKIERGIRYPVVFCHSNPSAAFRAPDDAYYVQVLTFPLNACSYGHS